MDGSITDHSDSDSGDSWTILEPTPEYAENVPQFPENLNERLLAAYNEKDEDTDGISIISDSDHESHIPPHKNTDENYITEEISTEKHIPSHITITPDITHFDENINIDKSFKAEHDILMETNEKLKTYVHRRNKRLSTVLNIIMLGSVITAAGVAIGHMWGAKSECTVHSTPSVNKILSNLYKLQEENAYLRNKLKELTSLSNFQKGQPKMLMQRCKKVFEEPLNSNNANQVTKCIDENSNNKKILESHLVEPAFEKEFLSEIKKLKTVYQQNKYWLDENIAKRIKYEEQNLKNVKYHANVNKTYTESKSLITENTKLAHNDEKVHLPSQKPIINESIDNNQHGLYVDKKKSYADSLKSEQKSRYIKKRENDKKWETEYDEHISKKRVKKSHEPDLENVTSEEEIKKDDRYNCHKCKYNKKKTEKWHKKQKRRNKYEQFDIKDLLKDYDDSHEKENKILEKAYNAIENKEKLRTESFDNSKINFHIKLKQHTNENYTEKENKTNWYENRVSLRKEYRNRLERELFGEKSLNDSGWYFRRMKRREQCRAKASNGTHKKVSKLNMNFKTKY